MVRITWIGAFGAACAITACNAEGGTTGMDPQVDAGPIADPDGAVPEEDAGETPEVDAGPVEPASAGAVFALSNDAEGNAVVMFARGVDGSLTAMGEFATGGLGTGMGLGSQGALAVDAAGEFLYVVNPGSHTIASMRIYDDHLGLVDTIDTAGEMPTSLAVHGSSIYVVNAGGAGGVTGFSADAEGQLARIEGAERALSSDASGPGQIGITPEGDWLVVTERATDRIATYAIAADGSLGEIVVNESEGRTPFGFDFTSGGVMVVSEAFGGDAGASAVSSYRVSDGGVLWLFSSSIPNGETAACWTAVLRDRFAYTTNTGSNTVSGYHIEDDGQMRLFDGGGETAAWGDEQAPIDMATSADDEYLYVLNREADTIVWFAVGDDGSLTSVGSAVDVPEASWGLAGL